MPQPVLRISRTSALSSPFVSLKNSMFGIAATITPPLAKVNPLPRLMSLGEHGDFVGLAVAVGVLENLDRVV